MTTISHDDRSDPGHPWTENFVFTLFISMVNIIITFLGITMASPMPIPGCADDGCRLPQENPVPATSATISSSKMTKIQRHAAAQVA